MSETDGVELLVVDDSSFNRLLLRRRLNELGYDRIVMATNGLEALEAIRNKAFDVVLLDLEMPELDGIGVLEHLHASGQSEPPVIVISALADMAGVVRCIELGAEDYLPKSFDPTLLRARLSAVLEKKRLRDLAAQRLAALEAELESARQAQLSLVPHDFSVVGSESLAIHALMVPARQVGGDLYDTFNLDERRVLFSVADVAGKGAQAALTMARGLALMRAGARHLAEGEAGLPDPGRILGLANDELAAGNERMTFITALLGVMDRVTGEVRMANAGHDGPILLTPGAEPRQIHPTRRRPALGMMEGISFGADSFVLAPGEGLVLYTDGITEAEDHALAVYTRDRLVALLARMDPAAAPDVLIAEMMEDLKQFTGGAAQSDDITAMALRFRG